MRASIAKPIGMLLASEATGHLHPNLPYGQGRPARRMEHFGIHLPDRSAEGTDAAVARVREAGGQLLGRGEHAPGVHCAYVTDLDGYAIEIRDQARPRPPAGV
jgi:catechol 2,3-dioxygenase-like lactoylglutathione lyase family enzyme